MAAVLIIGGGIAGAASAIALHKAGIEVTVYEAHPRSSLDAGAFLTLASNGMRALRQIDVDTLVAQAGSPLTNMRICNGQGIEIATVPISRSAITSIPPPGTAISPAPRSAPSCSRRRRAGESGFIAGND